MGDFPVLTSQLKGVLSTVSPESQFGEFAVIARIGAAGSAVWPTANKAFFHPVTINDFFTPKNAMIQVGTQAGNVDIGIFREDGGKVWSAGSTAVGAAGIQAFSVTAGTVLNPGTYYLAMWCDSVTAAFVRYASANLKLIMATKEQTGLSALPASATLVDATADYYPILAFVENSTT